jgi:hypothetical protein
MSTEIGSCFADLRTESRAAERRGFPVRVRLCAVAAGTLAVVALGGCAPSKPFAPVAVRRQGATPEVLYTACKPAKVKSAKVVSVKPNQTVIDGSEPVVWQVSFPRPIALRSLAVGGHAPDGTVVDVALARPLADTTEYQVVLQLDDGTSPHEAFQVNKLTGDHVRFQDRYVTPGEFTHLSECT